MLRFVTGLLVALVVVHGQTPPKPVSSSSPQMNMGVLAVASDSDGALFVDGERKLAITPDKIVTLRLSAGQHFVDLRDAKGVKLWEKVVNVSAGTQAAERISVKNTPSIPSPAQKVDIVAELTPCEESRLFVRWQDTVAACKKEDEILRSRWPEDMRESSDTQVARGRVEQANKSFSEHCAKSTRGCASLLYTLGDYEKALAEVSPQVDALKQQFESNEEFNKKTGIVQSVYPGIPEKLGAGYVADAYSLRGAIKYALSDTTGALADLGTAIDYIGVWRREGNQPEGGDALFFRPNLYRAYLYRAAIRYRIGKYEEAIADFNEYAALIKVMKLSLGLEEDKLGKLIRQSLKGSTRLVTTQPEAGISSSAFGDADIRGQIDSIARSGQYSPLPNPQVSGAGDSGRTTARRIIRNDTAYALHLFMSGPADRKLDLPPGGSSMIDLPAGSYRVAARVDASNVKPFYGVQILESGIEYTSQFFVK